MTGKNKINRKEKTKEGSNNNSKTGATKQCNRAKAEKSKSTPNTGWVMFLFF